MTFLVDSSVWIDHFRLANETLKSRLFSGLVVLHPHIIGELALGSLKGRKAVIGMLHNMPKIMPATDDEVLQMIENRRLFSRGIGFVDAHLLAAILIDGRTRLWTMDQRLNRIAEELAVAFQPADSNSPRSKS